jgi:hypothetical protein
VPARQNLQVHSYVILPGCWTPNARGPYLGMRAGFFPHLLQHPRFGAAGPAVDLGVVEPELDLILRRLHAVGAVADVAAGVDAVGKGTAVNRYAAVNHLMG